MAESRKNPHGASGPSGISVTTHWQGFNHIFYSGFGAITLNVIEQGRVAGRRVIDKGPAHCPAISPDGKRVAFIRKGGHVVCSSIHGSGPRVLAELTDDRGCLDWPDGDWIYFSEGGFATDGSAFISRVNYRTLARERVARFVDPERGNIPVRQWSWSMSKDARTLFTRVVDNQGNLTVRYGALFEIFLPHEDAFPVDIGLVLEGGKYCGRGLQGCQNAISPSGRYLLLGRRTSHETFTVAGSGGEDLRTFDRRDLRLPRDAEVEAFDLNGWACNSDEWICLMAGRGFRASRYSNQVLFNWVTGESILATGQRKGDLGVFDSAGDFWLSLEEGRETI